MSKDILYLSYDGMTDPLGQSQVLPYIIGLSMEGYQFTLISFEKKEQYAKNKSTIEQICKENNIDWHPLSYTRHPAVFSTIWDIFKLKKKVEQIQQQKQFELIHCRSYITSLIGLAFKRKYGVKFIFDMRGFWADERVDGNLWNLENPIYHWIYYYFKQKERLFLQFADRTVSLTENGKKEMLSWKIPDLIAEKITVIPCAADYNIFDIATQEKRRIAKENLGLYNNEFVLSYIGSIGTWYMLDEMLFFFSVLKKKYDASKFLFLTADSKDDILEKAKKHNLTKEDFIIQFAQRKDISKIAHAADFSIFFIQPAYSKKSSSPTKMGELMAMGIPIICNNNVGDVALILAKANAGFCLKNLTENEFVNTINQLTIKTLSSPVEIRGKSKDFYDLERGINLYRSFYNQLT